MNPKKFAKRTRQQIVKSKESCDELVDANNVGELRKKQTDTQSHKQFTFPQLSLRVQIRVFVYFSIITIVVMLIGREYVVGLGNWGYLGAFVISLISNASIILPTPGIAVIAMMTSDFNLLLLGVSAGIGGAIGATSSYIAGMISGEIVSNTRIYRLSLKAMNRFGGAIIFAATLAPFLPMDAASILAGGIRYPFKRYFLIMGSAHTLKMVMTTYLIANSTDWLTDWTRPFG